MNCFASARACKRPSHPWWAFVGTCSFILVVLAGLLALSSCAHTPAGVAREEGLDLTLSNSLASARAIAPALPQPVGGLAEGLLALGGALLTVWASHLHRSIRELKNGNGNPAPSGSTVATATAPPPPQRSG